MQPQSMTGYGRGNSGSFKAELRSSNHKNIDININMPHYLFSYDNEIRKIVKQKFSRGRIEVYIPRQENFSTKLKVNKALAAEYYDAFVSLKEELSIPNDIGIDLLASQRDIFVMDEPEIDKQELFTAIELALEELQKAREEEGKNLIADISHRLTLLGKYIEQVEHKRGEFVDTAKARLLERLKELLESVNIDESRLIQETAILVEKSDITEEIVRAKSHLRHFREILDIDDTIGKKMDFMVQELRREVNTISAKTHDYEISKDVVEMRHELEKIKEQVQNLQ
jgi:uncharacterized protein (TIGR00255 family)